jgi:hypothetical protein
MTSDWDQFTIKLIDDPSVGDVYATDKIFCMVPTKLVKTGANTYKILGFSLDSNMSMDEWIKNSPSNLRLLVNNVIPDIMNNISKWGDYSLSHVCVSPETQWYYVQISFVDDSTAMAYDLANLYALDRV